MLVGHLRHPHGHCLTFLHCAFLNISFHLVWGASGRLGLEHLRLNLISYHVNAPAHSAHDHVVRQYLVGREYFTCPCSRLAQGLERLWICWSDTSANPLVTPQQLAHI